MLIQSLIFATVSAAEPPVDPGIANRVALAEKRFALEQPCKSAERAPKAARHVVLARPSTVLVRFDCDVEEVETAVFYITGAASANLVQLPTVVTRNAWVDDTQKVMAEQVVTGIATRSVFALIRFRSNNLSLHAEHHWGGLGNGSTHHEWRYRDGVFPLVYFREDQTRDGQINPIDLLDHRFPGVQ